MIKYYDKIIRDTKEHGIITVKQVFEESSNVDFHAYI